MRTSRILIVCVAVAAYLNTLQHGFVYDDVTGIVTRTDIAKASDLHSLMGILWLPWRPFLQWTYGLTFYLAGFNPLVFHLTNLLIHALNSVLIYEIARKLSERWAGSNTVRLFPLAAGLIHAAHPLYSEAVAYIWGRSSLLCATFYFGSLLLVLCGRGRDLRYRWMCYSAAIMCGILAWKTKEEAITLPLLVALFFVIEGDWRPAVALTVIPVAVALLWSSQISHLYREVGENRELVSAGLEPTLPTTTYTLTAVKAAVWYYLRRAVYPVDLNADPYVTPVTSAADAAFLSAAVALAALGGASLFLIKRWRIGAFALGALLLSPLISYIMMPLADVVAEHRIYIASLGIDLLGAWALTRPKHFSIPLLAGITMVLAGMTIHRNRVWKDSLTLWSDVEQQSPQRLRPHINLGEAFQAIGANDLALREYGHAVALQPKLAPVYVNVGSIHLARGELVDAEALFRKASDLSPGLVEPWVNLAIIRIRQGNGPAALQQIERAAAMSPDSFLVHFTRGDILLMLGRYDEAAADFRKASELRPDLKDLEEQVQGRLSQIETVQHQR